MDALPITITKTWLGQLGIALGGIASILLVLLGFMASIGVPGADGTVLFALSVLVVALVTAFTAVWIYVYSLSYIYLSEGGLTAVNWQSLFNKQNVQAEWSDIEDVSVVTSGIFATMLGFGTLNVQTAGTQQKLRMVMIPNAEHWQNVIQHYQDQATPNEVMTP